MSKYKKLFKNAKFWDQKLAVIFVVPLSKTGITPNQITFITLMLAIFAGYLFALGDQNSLNYGSAIFVIARFMDNFDGMIARIKNMETKFGYFFDYTTGGISFAVMYLGIGYGLQDSTLSFWAIVLGIAGAISSLACLFMNLERDKKLNLKDGEWVGYPRAGGFELEDGIYLLAPITWMGWIIPFFVLSAIGSIFFFLWTLGRLIKKR